MWLFISIHNEKSAFILVTIFILLSLYLFLSYNLYNSEPCNTKKEKASQALSPTYGGKNMDSNRNVFTYYCNSNFPLYTFRFSRGSNVGGCLSFVTRVTFLSFY